MIRLPILLTLAWSMAVGPARLVDVPGTVRAGDSPVEDAVVWIDVPGASRPTNPPAAVLTQRDVAFSPHVLAVQVGTTVTFPNDDRIFHNVFSFHNGKRFDLGLYPVGTVRTVLFDRPGLSRVFCNIHPQMAAYIMVVDTPYFAVSDDRGNFVIRGVPDGTYRYHAWRPGGDVLDAEVRTGARELQVRLP